jgi:hypothetical protein
MNTKNAERNQLMSVLGITSEAQNEKYLRLPVYMGWSKKELLNI